MRESADNAGTPDNSYGWGIVNALRAAFPSVANTPSLRTPENLKLYPALPNPFNPRTTIRFELPVSARVRLTVHDVRGAFVTTLLDDRRSAGPHAEQWNGTDRHGRSAADAADDPFKFIRWVFILFQ